MTFREAQFVMEYTIIMCRLPTQRHNAGFSVAQ